MKYRTKPVEIVAIKFTGNYRDVTKLFPDIRLATDDDQTISVWDYLQNTWVKVNIGDYIIKGLKGEFYPCDPEVFETKYEPAVPARVRRTGGHMILIGGVADGRIVDLQQEIPEFFMAGGCRYERTQETFNGRVVFEYRR